MLRPGCWVLLLVAGAIAPGTSQEAKPRTDRRGDPLPAGAIARLGSARLRHAGAIGSLAFAPDGKWLATGGYDEALYLWNARTGRELRRFAAIEGQVYAVAFAPGGRLLAASGGHNTIHLWEPDTGREVRRLSGHQFGVFALAFSPDGRRLASAAGDRSTRVWDVGTGKQLARISEPRERVRSVAWFPDGKALVTAGDDQTARFWDADTGLELPLVGPAPGTFSTAVLSPDGRALATTDDRGGVDVWEPVSGKKRFSVPGVFPHFTADGQTLVTVVASGEAVLWEAASGKERRRFAVGQATASAAALSPDGNVLALAGSAVRLWDLRTGKLLLPTPDDAGEVNALAYTADGRSLLAASSGGALQLRAAATGEEEQRFKPVGARLTHLAVAANGKAAGVCGENTVVVWDLGTRKEVHRLRGPQRQVSGVAFAPDGRTLASVGNRRIVLWDVATGKEVRRLADGEAGAPVVFAPDGRGVFAAAAHGTVALWDRDTGTKVRTFRELYRGEFTPSITSIALSPDGRMLALTWVGHFEGGAIDVYEVASGQPLASFGGHRSFIWSLAFSPDGVALASGGNDGVVLVREVLTGTERHRFIGQRGQIFEIAYAPDGRTLASRGSGGTALIWDVSGRLKGKSARPVLPPARLEAYWAALRGEAEGAFEAVRALIEAPAETLPFLKKRLQPVAPVPGERLQELLAALDDARFPVRQRAMAELERLGDLAEAALRRVLAEDASLEVKRRVAQILHRLAEVSPERLRAGRSLLILERIGGDEARAVLANLTRGAPAAAVTREARAALARLARRPVR